MAIDIYASSALQSRHIPNGEFLTRAEYEKRYTHRGTLRASLPPPGVKRPRGRPRKNQPAALPSRGQEAGTAPASGNQLVVISRNQPATSSPVTQITTHLGPNPDHKTDHKTAHKTEHETEDGANAYTTTGSPQPQRAACIYRRLLDAGPIFYEVARSIGLIEDLQTAYHNPVLVNQMLSLSFHWLSTADNVARRYSLFARNHVLPFMGKMDEEFLASFYSGLSGMQSELSHLFELRLKRLPEGARINYDSTSIPTTASDAYYAQISLTREGAFESMEHFSLWVDQETHQPVLYDLYGLYGGATPDGKTIRKLCLRLKELSGKSRHLIVCDRGYEILNSLLDSLLDMQLSGKHCLMAVRDLEQRDVARAIEKNLSELSDSSRHLIRGSEVVGLTEPLTITHRGHELKLWLHLMYDHSKASQARSALYKKLEKAEARWNSADEDKRRSLMSSDRVIKTFFVRPNEETIKCKLLRNSPGIDREIHQQRIFANVSNTRIPVAEAYKIYRERDCIEKVFKSGKMSVNLDTPRSHRQDTMEGRFVIGFIVLCILAELNLRLSLPREFKDGFSKPLKPHTFSVSDVVAMTSGITLEYGVQTNAFDISGKFSDVDVLCMACGTEGVYNQIPTYLGNPIEMGMS